MNNEDRKAIDSIKLLGIDMINEAGSGHPGIVLGAAPIIYTLFANHLNIKPSNPKWWNRDRFILSAGHGSALLYSTLFHAGYNIPQEELKNFRRINSILPGHPEVKLTPGVEMSTGPLGQGVASAVGMALAERYLASVLEEDVQNQNLINHYTYVLCGDGDLMEGVSYEAASFAGTQKLNKLIILYDSNNITLDESTNVSFKENVLKRFESMGWHTEFVKDGENIKEIDKAIDKAKKSNLPSIIEVKTIIGRGSKYAGQNTVHGKPLDAEDIASLRSTLSVNNEPFIVNKDVLVYFRDKINKRVEKIYDNWQKNMSNLKTIGNEYAKRMVAFLESNNINFDFQIEDLQIAEKYVDELRNSNYQIMNIISDKTPFFLGGSADLSSSCKTHLKNFKNQSKETPNQKNIYFGIREHAMGAILNGMALYGLRVFGSTFLTFSDYLKPAIRLSALMDLPVTYIFTHDSVSIGEDGATHQPVEQLAALRTIPNFYVYRPADINEIIGSWAAILKDSSPNALIISKQKCSSIANSNAKAVSSGAYIIKEEKESLNGIIMASGTEVHVAVNIAKELEEENINLRVVSTPCIELFNISGNDYKNKILDESVPIITIEASNDPTWLQFATSINHNLKIDDYGHSGKSDEILKSFEFDHESLKNKIKILIK